MKQKMGDDFYNFGVEKDLSMLENLEDKKKFGYIKIF